MENNIQILSLHIEVLKFLFLWPRDNISKRMNYILMYGYFVFSIALGMPVIWAACYQLYIGIDDSNILLEAMIGCFDIMCYELLYISLLMYRDEIRNIFTDINKFLRYCDPKIIREPDMLYYRYTKYAKQNLIILALLVFVFVSVTINLLSPLISRNHCIAAKESDFYRRHDPCGLPTKNLYPFDANKPSTFWIACLTEGLYIYHLCFLVAMITAITLGLLEQITTQLRHCGQRFQEIEFDSNSGNIDHNARQEFASCVRHHQEILAYAGRVFNAFSPTVISYMTITSFETAVIGYQIIVAETSYQDRFRYSFLLFAWAFLFFLVALKSQIMEDQSCAIADLVYSSQWHSGCKDNGLKKGIALVIARAQNPLQFKVRFLGVISLPCYLAVMKSAYSFFTILLTATED